MTPDKGVDYAKFKTYSWTEGWASPDKAVDRQVKAAVDRELGTLGLTPRPRGPGDVLVAYYAVRRTDVDVKAKATPPGGADPELPVGTLEVVLLDPASRRRLLTLRTDKPVDMAPSKREAVINEAIAELMSHYPTRTKK